MSSIAPNNGPAAGGTSVSITGAGFALGSTVNFGGAAAGEVSVNSSTSISATAPEGSGTMDVTVASNGETSAANAGDRFEYRTALTNTALPSISGLTQDGETLSASPGSWTGSGPVSYAYQWRSCGPGGGDCEDIEGATARRYTLDDGDLETTLRARVTATNVVGSVTVVSALSAEISLGAPSEIEAPAIFGVPRAGEALLAGEGMWAGAEGEARYQWESCNAQGTECADVRGATSTEYPLAEGDIGSTLRVRVGASNELGSFTAVSDATSPIGAASDTLEDTSAPTLAGTPRDGQTLIVTPGGWTGVEPITFTYQWQSCNRFGGQCEDIEDQRGTSYPLDDGAVGSVVRVVVTATDVNGSQSQTVSTAQPVASEEGPLVEEAPAIAGTPAEGQALHASSGEWSAEGSLSYEYQWVRCDELGRACAAIEGATTNSYTPVEADVGTTIGVLVTATDAAGGSIGASVLSPVVDGAGPQRVSAPSIAGAGQLGEPLEADPGIWIGEGAIGYAYKWQRCEGEECANIAGATESAYTPVEADVGSAIRVTVTATSTAGTANASSGATGTIVSEPRVPAEVSAPSVEGARTAGQTLSASAGVWSGSAPISYAYQWQRCNEGGGECADIEGATSETYALGEDDIGAAMRVVVGAANSAGSAEATSAPTEAVGTPGPPVAAGEEPSIHGDTQVGQRVFAENGGWTGSRPLSFDYQWQRCDAAGESCAAIEGATKPSYTIASGDAGLTLRIAVTATNGLGSAVALSAPAAVAPEGQASTTPALEAAEAADPSILAPAEAAQLEEQSVQPQIANSEELIAASGGLTSSTISRETSGEFAVNTTVGEMSVRPIRVPVGATTTPTIVNGAVAAFAGTATETDTFVRPTPLGATTLLQLRSSSAPTSFTWEVGIGGDQELEVLPDGDVAVVEPAAGPSLEGELPAESFEEPESASAEEPSGEGAGERAAEEEMDESLEEEGLLEKRPEAPETSTPKITPQSGELHPQDTAAQYERATSSMESAEEQTAGTTIMVIEAPQVLDANGNTVPATLSAQGDTVTVTITPEESTTFPATAEMSVAATSDHASAAKAHVARYGLSDQLPTAFKESEEDKQTVKTFDKRLREGPLKVTRARYVMSWTEKAPYPNLVAWLEAVKEAKLKPYVTLGVCYRAEECLVPPAKEYLAWATGVMKAFVNGSATNANIPAVRLWGAWNEPADKRAVNGDAKKRLTPHEAAWLWGELEVAAARANCLQACIVTAGEFSKYGVKDLEARRYVAKYEATIREGEYHHMFPTWVKPRVWGMHDYKDIEQSGLRDKSAKKQLPASYVNTEAEGFIKTTKRLLGPARFWMSEQGVRLTNHEGLREKDEDQRVAAEDFLRLGKMRQVEWAYYYEYRAPANEEEEFDSALLDHSGEEPADWRPAYCVLALGENGCKPPTVVTKSAVEGATGDTASQAALTVDPEGLPTEYWLEYGTTTAYGSSTTPTLLAYDGGVQSERAMLRGLEPCTTYHYRAMAESKAGIGEGEDATVTTECSGNSLTGIAVGLLDACDLLSSGTVECWGDNDKGQLGDGTTIESELPVPVSGIEDATDVMTGDGYSCALLADGNAECWGINALGQLGGGEESYSATPVVVSGVTSGAAIASPEYFPCVALADGEVKCWGSPAWNGHERMEPTAVAGLQGPAAGVGGGIAFACAVLASGHIECWGASDYGLGDGVHEWSETPVEVHGIETATGMTSQGLEFACAVLASGEVKCWGDNAEGQLGDGTRAPSAIPVEVKGVTDAVSVSAGYSSACALLADGGVDCWGEDEEGGLGNGTDIASSTPVPVSGVTDATAMGAGWVNACAVLAGSTIKCWGSEYLVESP